MKQNWPHSIKGFTLIESLFSFSVTLVIVSSLGVFATIGLSLNGEMIDNTLNGAVSQLATTLITARNISYGSTLSFEDEVGSISDIFLDDGKLVKTPGYVIYALDISDVNFYVEDNLIYLKIQKDELDHTFLIGCDYPREVDENDQIEK